MIAELADGRKLEFPDGTDPAVIQRTVKNVLAQGTAKANEPSMAQKIAAKPEGTGLIGNIYGAVTDPILNMASGMIAKPASEVMGLAAAAMGKDDPVGFQRDMQDRMTFSPRTDAGAAIVNSPFNPVNAIGRLIHSVSDKARDIVGQGASDGSARGMVANAIAEAIPQGIGFIGAKNAKPLADSVKSKGRDTVAASLNAVEDATLAKGRELGYVTKPTAVNPSFINKRLESLGGKAAIDQEVAFRNQEVTNRAAVKELGLPEGTAITEAKLKAFRNERAAPYREVAELPTLPPDRFTEQINPMRGAYPLIGPVKQAPKEALHDLKAARSEAKNLWNDFNRTGRVEVKDKAKSASAKVESLENYLEETAIAAGKPELAAQLKQARQDIAKSYDIERSINVGNADISAPTIGRMLDKDKPLSGNLKTIGEFANAFPSAVREGAKLPTSGVSKLEAITGLLLGAAGVAAAGPIGMVAGALPLLSGPARALALSPAYQKLMASRNYSSPAHRKVIDALITHESIKFMSGSIPSQQGEQQ
jgi:hypothetical protein